MQQDSDPKHPANTIKDFIKQQKWKVLDQTGRSPELIPTENLFHLLGTQTNQQLKEDAVQAWKKSAQTARSYLIVNVLFVRV